MSVDFHGENTCTMTNSKLSMFKHWPAKLLKIEQSAFWKWYKPVLAYHWMNLTTFKEGIQKNT